MSAKSTMKHVAARLLVLAVFASNVYCIVSFLMQPEAHVAAYQLSGEGASTAIAGLGVAFAMWNATYPPVIAAPQRFRSLFAVVLAQQAIGLVGETYLYLGLGDAQAVLAASILRFIVFDAIGLMLLVAAFALSRS